jgi:hypothetical protein
MYRGNLVHDVVVNYCGRSTRVRWYEPLVSALSSVTSELLLCALYGEAYAAEISWSGMWNLGFVELIQPTEAVGMVDIGRVIIIII